MTSVQPEAAPASGATPAQSGFVASLRTEPTFEAIYREHFRFVWRSVRRFGIRGAAVDDVVQEIFLVVHRRLESFEARSSTKTWLYGILRRVVADHRRSLRRKPTWLEGNESEIDDVSDSLAKGPEASAAEAEQVRLLYRVLDALDEDKREVFILAELEGMTLLEIGEALEINPNTASSRLRAARQRFEEALARETANALLRGPR
jgi:RNA polymerase sigma-70 factor (ECF subfamily)